MMYYCAQWIKDIQVYRLVLLLFIVHSRRLNALLNSLIKRKDCWSGELKSKCPLLLRHYEGLFVLKSLIYTQAQCKLDFWLAVMRRRTVAFTQRTVGLQKDCSVRDFKNALEMALFRRIWRHNSATQSRLHFKLGRVVDPIKTHILCENQEFLHTLWHFL